MQTGIAFFAGTGYNEGTKSGKGEYASMVKDFKAKLKEYAHLLELYGRMNHFQTFGKQD